MANYKLDYTGEQINTAIGKALGGGGTIGGGYNVNYFTDALNMETIIVFGGNVIYAETPYAPANEEYFGLHNNVGDTSGNGSCNCYNVAFIIIKSSHVSDIRLTGRFYDTALGTEISSISSNNLRHILIPLSNITLSDTD